MRKEKKYLVQEVSEHLGKSSYVFLADYKTITVNEVASLREQLASVNAEFHVVKNSALKLAAKERSLPDLNDALKGQTAIITGGDNPSEVAKVITKFKKDNKKCSVKLGVLDERAMTAEEINALAKLPSLDVLKAQFLGLLNKPAEQTVRVMQAVPEGLLNVLKAHSEKGGA